MILFINFVILTICETLDQKTIQPYGPKMLEELYQKESSYTTRMFDRVQLECNLVSNTSSVNLSGNRSSQQDFKVYDVDNQSTTTNNNDIPTHSVMCEEKAPNTTQSVKKTGKRKRRMCSPGSVKTCFKAIDDGKLLKVKRLLSRSRLDVNCRGNVGQTAVMEAAIHAKKNIFDYFVSQNCDLSAVDEFNETVLHYACTGGSKYIVKKLLDDHGIDIDSRGQDGRSPLMSVICDATIKLFKFLLNRGADIRARDDYNDTILHVACKSGFRKMVILVLSLNSTHIECRGSSGRTPLMTVVYDGYIDTVKLLRDRGADVNTVDDKNDNILHVASFEGYITIVRYILSFNIAQIDSIGYLGKTPLMQAAENGHTAIVRLLRRRGADMKTVDDLNNTILHLACVTGHIDMVKYVLSQKLHGVKYRGKLGRYPLMVAVEHGHITVVRYLLKRNKAHSKTTDKDGMTVLHVACFAGWLDMVKYLVTLKELKGFEKMKTKTGDTPLQMAMKNCHLHIVSFLKSKE